MKKYLPLLILLITPLTLLYSRDVEITVEDADLAIPLEGATIRSWDGTIYNCDDNGRIILSVPDDRQVTIQASYPGYENGVLNIPTSGTRFTLGLYLSGVLVGNELLIEAQRPGESETRIGRSVAISGEILERSSQIGVIEDVMTSIKLLPGVGYSGMFGAQPSIRGGSPGDLTAVLDGYYIEIPYYWGGGFSIFDPNMVASAQLSHGVFSARYGHTISGLLEVRSKKAEPDFASMELGITTSTTNLNASVPLGSKGGLMLTGRVTYWDAFVWAAQQLSKVVDNEQLALVNTISTAPYIRGAQISGSYRFNADLELAGTAFIGTDGVGAHYQDNNSDISANWGNIQTFFITSLTYNPQPSMLIKAATGAGLIVADLGVRIDRNINIHDGLIVDASDTSIYVQGRVDFDWDLGSGFILSSGYHELYNQYITFYSVKDLNGAWAFLDTEVNNRRFHSSAYILAEYSSPGNKFGAELGLRMDHLYFKGKSFNIQTMPVLNPRLNLDFNVFRNWWIIESLDLTLGTGMFSSMDSSISLLDMDSLGNNTLKPNRSWTSVAGIKIDFSGGWSLSLEGYYKYVFDHAYQYLYEDRNKQPATGSIRQRFNGNGIIWGFDLMLQKFETRYWDGWLTYSYTYAKYHMPESTAGFQNGKTIITDKGWYYPSFHRFHYLNLVLNFRPFINCNIYTRFGLASGTPDGDTRTAWTIPWDLKFSFYISNKRSKVLTEIYLAAENLMSLFYVDNSNASLASLVSFDTDDDLRSSITPNFNIPIPMVSFGIRWSF
ncbi:MAG: TonB-dependent receptor plug domain-containing protein [Treponema sp.]|jgi:hypothetical protein|nr:TonB-dependent receptor plug domain-containing protein [Treponema sp.]